MRGTPARAAGLVALLLAAGLAACARPHAPRPRDGTAPRPGAAEPPAFTDDLPLASLQEAVTRTRSAWERLGDAATPAAADRLLAALAAAGDAPARRRAVESLFAVRALPAPVLMTSYYEPELAARLAPDARFRWPLHARPPDLVEVDAARFDPTCRCRARLVGRVRNGDWVPYHTRADIYDGALDGRRLELAWTDDLLGAFLLQVQGSGRLRLPGGRRVPVRFAGTNGHPYRALARILADRGLLDAHDATIPGIRRAVDAMPVDEQLHLLAENPRYGFFAVDDGPGPAGSLGVPLTAGRSIAADPTLVPPGSLVWIDMPSVRRFAVVQDTGAAITGSHVDLFAGAGAEAEAFAGSMRDRGRVFVLVPAAAGPALRGR